MYSHLDNVQEHQNKSTVNDAPVKQGENAIPDFVDNSPEAKEAAQLQAMADNSPEAEQTAQLQSIADSSPEAKEAAKLQAMADEHGAQEEQPKQKKVNNTGLPDDLKTGIENLSGFSMDDVKVHYNSNKPAELQAHAYAEGTDIYIGPGQEKHLPHEAWHVVQQKQGRVKPTLQMEGGVDVNDDKGLEQEADVMGRKAKNVQLQKIRKHKKANSSNDVTQRAKRAANNYKKVTPRIASPETRTTKKGKKITDENNNTAHHIVPHSSLKQIYESILDTNINTNLRQNLIKSFLPDTDKSKASLDKDDLATKYLNAIQDSSSKLYPYITFNFLLDPKYDSTASGMSKENIKIIKQVNSYIEWAQGNQFYGPNANKRFETDKTGIDTIGKFYVEFERDGKKNGYDSIEEHGQNLKNINGDDSEKEIYANKLKDIISKKIYKLRISLSKKTLGTAPHTSLNNKLEEKYDKLIRLHIISKDVDPSTVIWIHEDNDKDYKEYKERKKSKAIPSKITAINTERLIEQGKIGAMTTGKENQFNSEHWIKIESDKQVEVIESLYSKEKSNKVGNYIHYSEILNKKGDSKSLSKADKTVFDVLYKKAQVAIKKDLKNSEQITLMLNDDPSTISLLDTEDKIQKVIVYKLNSSPLKKLIEKHSVTLTDNQVKSIHTELLDSPSLKELVTTHSNKLSAIQIRNIDITLLDPSSLKELVATHSNKLKASQVENVKIKSLDPASLKELVAIHSKKLPASLVKKITSIAQLEADEKAIKAVIKNQLRNLDANFIKEITKQEQIHHLEHFIAKAKGIISIDLAQSIKTTKKLNDYVIQKLTKERLTNLDPSLIQSITKQGQIHHFPNFVGNARKNLNDILVKEIKNVKKFKDHLIKLLTKEHLANLDPSLIQSITKQGQIHDLNEFILKHNDHLSNELVLSITTVGSLSDDAIKLLTKKHLDKLDPSLIQGITKQGQIHNLNEFIAVLMKKGYIDPQAAAILSEQNNKKSSNNYKNDPMANY